MNDQQEHDSREQAAGARSTPALSASEAFLDPGAWSRLSEAETDEQFGGSWLALQTSLVGGTVGAVLVLERRESGAVLPAAVWPQGATASVALDTIAQRALSERKGVVARNDAGRALEPGEDLLFEIAFPIIAAAKVRGAAGLEIRPRGQMELQTAMRQLQWGLAWVTAWMTRSRTEPQTGESSRLRSVLEIVALTLEQPGFRGSATAAATELATRFTCDRASIGLVRRGQVKVQALSHSAQFGKQMDLVRAIGLAMGESVDQQATLVFPEPEHAGRHVLHAHQQLARAHSDAAICTIPLLSQDGGSFGALMLERSAPDPFDDRTVAICESAAALLGPILEAKKKNDLPLPAKAGDSLLTQAKKLFGPRHMVAKLTVAGILVAAIFFTFATAQHRVTAKTTLEGEVRRVVAAPFRGFIYEAKVRSGDVVRKDQPMASLDVRDLRLENEKTKTEREQFVLEHRKEMAAGDRAAVSVLEKKILQSDALIRLYQERIDRATITAPFDGIVVNGDLSQSLGAPVETGQVMFEIAPLERYRVMMQVDERAIGEVKDGQSGRLVLTSMPREPLPFKVTRVTPVSKAEEGRNFFIVEGRLAEVSPRIRPGMEGYGKIEVGRRKVIWIWTHETIEWIRMWMWKWLV